MPTKARIFPAHQITHAFLYLVLLAIVAVLLWPLPQAQQRHLATQQQIQLALDVVSPALTLDLVNLNLLNMQNRLQALIEYPGIQSIQVLDQDERVVLQLGQPLQGEWLEQQLNLNSDFRGQLRVELLPVSHYFWSEQAVRLVIFLLISLGLTLVFQFRIAQLLRLKRKTLLQPLSGHLNSATNQRLIQDQDLEQLRDQWLAHLKLACTTKKHLQVDDVLTLRRMIALPNKEPWQGELIVVRIAKLKQVDLKPTLKQLLALYDGYHCPLSDQIFFGLNGHIEDSLWSAICVCYVLRLIYPKDTLCQAIDLDLAELKPDRFAGLPLWRMHGPFEQRLNWFLACAPADGIVLRENLFNFIDANRLDCQIFRDLSLPDQVHELWLLESIKAPYNSLLQKQAEHLLACMTPEK